MLSQLKATIVEALTSKKAIAAAAGLIIAAAGRIGLDLSTEAVTQILTPIVAYILAQGFADFGKPAAIVQRDAAQ